MSVSGEVALEMTNALDFVWGPGDQLAVSRGGFDSEGNAYPESLTIWDARSRASRTYPVSAPGICWGDSTTVLLDDWRTITELTLPGAKRRVSRYHGLQASPDGRYSLSRRPESSDVLWDEVRKRDITAEVVQLIGQPLLTFDTSASAFWIGGTRPGHLLAVPIMGRRGGADDVSSGFEVRVVDVMSLRVVRSLPGRFLAPWPDRSGLIVSVGRGLRSISLRD